MRQDNIQTIENYLKALKSKDLSAAALADELIFSDPIAGSGAGAENFKAFLSGFLPAINDVRVFSHVCEGEYVVTHWEVDAVFGIIPILEKFRVSGGQITEIAAFFDPRLVLGN